MLNILTNRIAGGDPIGTVRLYHGGLLLLAWFGGFCLIGGLRGRRPPAWPALLAAYLLVVVCPTVPRRLDFGQREHLFVLILLPWLAWRLQAIPPPSAWQRLVLAFLLGALGTIKPTFIAIPMVVEFFRGGPLARLGASEGVAVVAGMLAPFIGLALLDPAAIGLFVGEVLPVHLMPWYRLGFGISPLEIARRPQALVSLGVATVLLVLLVRGIRRGVIPAREARGWAVAAAIAGLGVLAQGTGFEYHFIPLEAVLWMALIVTASRVVGARVATATALTALAIGWISFVTTVRWRRIEPSAINRIVSPHASVMMFTTDVIFSYDAWHQGWEFRGTWGARVLLAGQLRDPDRPRAAIGLAQDRIRTLATLSSRPEFLLVRWNEVPGRASLEDALIRDLHVLPAPGYRRLPDEEVIRRAGPDSGWIVYVRQRVR